MNFNPLFQSVGPPTDKIDFIALNPNEKFYGISYTDDEMKQLATINYKGFIRASNLDIVTQINIESLKRFGLILRGNLYINDVWKDWGWGISDRGHKFIDSIRPMHFGCRCVHSIKLSCVCAEKTFCPNLEHSGNGCHGSHD